jgi:hypothetical protein
MSGAKHFPARMVEGTWPARIIVGISVLLATLALYHSGSLTRAASVVARGGVRGDFDWEVVARAFSSEITGDPSLVVAGLKTLFAVVVAFAVACALPTARGQLGFKALGIELNGAQSAAVVWCVVFVLVKLA